jgi:hypothetical protein
MTKTTLGAASFAVLLALNSRADADTIVMRASDLNLFGEPTTFSTAFDRLIFTDRLTSPESFDVKTPIGRARIAAGFLGKGVNFWGGNKSLPTQCVSFPASYVVNAPTATGTTSADNWNSLNQVDSLTSHYRSESFGASASVTYKIFSLGGSSASSSSNTFNSTSRYIDIDKGVISDSFSISQPPGSPPLTFTSPASAASKKAEDFARICGQSYIWKVEFGSTVVGTIDFNIEMTANTSTNQSSVSAGITGILSGAINTAAAWTSLAQQSSIQYNIKGGPAKSAKPEEWIPQLKDFGSQPADAASNDVIVFKTLPYRTLPDSNANMADVNAEASGTLQNLQWAFTDSVQKLTDRQRALSNLAHVTQAEAVIRADVIALANYIDGVQPVFKVCSEATTDAAVETCKDKAKLAGLPPPVTNLTFK